MSLPPTGFNPYMPPELSIDVSSDAIYFAEHRTAHYYVSFKIIPDNNICEFFYCDATTRVDTRFPQDVYSNIYSRLPRNQAAFASIDWAPVIENPEEIVKHLVLQYLKAGVDPFGDDDLESSIFQPFEEQLIGADYFKQVWDAIHEELKTNCNKTRLINYIMDGPLKDPEIHNYIIFSDDPEDEEYCRRFNQGRLVHTTGIIRDKSFLYLSKLRVGYAIVNQEIESIIRNNKLTNRQVAYLHIYLRMYDYLSCSFQQRFDDLAVLNNLLINQWRQDHPDEAFPYVQEGVHFELDYRNDLMLAKPTPRTHELKSVKLHKVLLKTILNYFNNRGITSQNYAYYKFVGFVPHEISHLFIAQSGELKFFTEAYTSSYIHGPLTHFVQLFLLVQALTNDRISLKYENESFTPKQFLEMIFDPDFSCPDTEFQVRLWGHLFDDKRTTNSRNGLLTNGLNVLSFFNPGDVASMIRELTATTGFRELSTCLILSELKKLIKYSKIYQTDLDQAYVFLTEIGLDFDISQDFDREFAFRVRPNRPSVLENIFAEPGQDPFLIQLKRV